MCPVALIRYNQSPIELDVPKIRDGPTKRVSRLQKESKEDRDEPYGKETCVREREREKRHGERTRPYGALVPESTATLNYNQSATDFY